jgi:pantothenate kinase
MPHDRGAPCTPPSRPCRTAPTVEPIGPDMITLTVEEAVERARVMLGSPGRQIVGIAGAPGSGKSTLATRLSGILGRDAVVVPMDGFHLADVALDALEVRGWKGRIDTFDGHGYVALLRRLRDEPDNDIYAPAFERDLEQPLAGAICVPTSARLVITDGNYLLVDSPPWSAVADVADEIWFCAHDEDERRRRLIERHIRFGKTRDEAHAWVERVDDPNAQLVSGTRHRATLVVKT